MKNEKKNAFLDWKENVFDCTAQKSRLPLPYSTKHRFGQRPHKGYD